MKQLTAADCLWTRIRRVQEDDEPTLAAEGTVFAVFARSPLGQRFCGLASNRELASHPAWKFSHLIEHCRLRGVNPGTSLSNCLSIMQLDGLDALPVIDSAGRFVGVVTQASLLRGLLRQERQLLQQVRLAERQAKVDRGQLARWPARLSELHLASQALLSVLTHTTLQSDLLQVAIEALVKLLGARYGAIGLLNADGGLAEFCTTGMSAGEAACIGDKPTGKGLLGLVVREGTTLRLEDMTQHPQSAGFPPHHPPMKALLAVPVSHGGRGRVHGRIYLCDKASGDAFTAEDELLATTFAHSLSLILDNAHEMAELLKAHASLEYLAHYDTLTALPNRVLANDRLKLALTHARRHGSRVAALFVDLDNFKQTNDSFGHTVGDQLLQLVAQRLLRCVREGDTVARLSGDEFLLMLPDIADVQDAAVVAQKILNALAPACQVEDHEIFISASIGISVFPDDAGEMEDLLRFADTAMFHAKQGGRNNWQFFAGAMNDRISRHTLIENALRRAVERHELTLHYQPQVDIRSGAIVGMEALLRWHSPQLGQVSPVEFIPVAEDAGLIVAIGEWVLINACAQARLWADMGFGHLRVAVNVSARQFRQHNFSASVRHILRSSGIPRGMLELELTESLMMEELDEVVASLDSLCTLGIRFSIDDFGTGYSSLSRLKKLPVSMLKIDQSFVRDVTSDADDAAIAEAIITLAHSLRLRVIAEGVETNEQLDFMLQRDCDEIQGFLFSHALPVDELTTLLRSDRRLHGANAYRGRRGQLAAA